MSNTTPATWYHSNRYHAQSACPHCQGVIRHEPWCILRSPDVCYAFQIIVEPGKLTIGDALILHSLGVAWERSVCRGNCEEEHKTLA
jgi:hypothetical protein